ncbi:DUF4435 domain-containing protein [Aquitalea sp. FJL05]|uniref:DUF4435 domain-containing protein n=1 Tax=Aquitalea sp. FJL05 TaxID=2153366 RepID=UPI0013154876|nr:DUF4435 domain-containing protein [Aquitalea sp. FJL05]
MTFMRTISGIKNFNKFHKVDWIFYIEGKRFSEKETYDEIFYQATLSEIIKDRKFKIKVVGSRSEVLDYHAKIAIEGIENSIAIVDNDLAGINHSLIAHNKLITTYGYSWENDFWSEKLCSEVAMKLIPQSGFINNLNSSGENIIQHTYRIASNRAAKLSVLDSCAHIFGKALLQKNGGSCGISMNNKLPWIISHNEIGRIIRKAKNYNIFDCEVSKATIELALGQINKKIIQGHLWENISITMIATLYKKITNERSAPNELIKSLAFGEFKSNPLKYLDDDFVEHLKSHIENIT